MKRIFSVFLALVMMISGLNLVTVSAQTDYVEVNTVESFKKVLEADGDMNIVVTGDIIYTCMVNDIGDYWITLGSGTKKLNLSGHNIELNADSGVETTMIRVPEGAELIIDDSSGDNSGALWCYGRMETPNDDERGPRYLNGSVKYRNVLEIDGGLVTINGGTLEAGRSKKQWIYNGRDVYDLRHLLDYTLQFGVLGMALGARYDGYAWQQVNGDCITLKDGALLINDGVFLGRGFSHLETFMKENDNDVDVEFSRSACLRLLGGTAVIGGGDFHGKGNADVLNYTKDAKVTVKEGTFSTNNLRVLLVPTIIVTLHGYFYPYVIGHEQRYGYKYHPASDVGSIRLSADMLDPQRNTVELNGEIIPVSEWTPKIISNTGNIGSSTVVVTHHITNSDRRNFASGRNTKKEINRLNIDGTNAYGMSLSADNLSCSAEGVRSISVNWFHNDMLCDEEEKMVAGKYQVKVTVRLEKDYAFAENPSFTIMGDAVSSFELSANKMSAILYSKVYEFECPHTYNEDTSLHFDADKHFLLCSVCNKIISQEEHYFGDGEKNGDTVIYKCGRCDYAYEELDDGKIKINYVNIDIPNPEAGIAPDYNGVIGSEGMSFAEGGDEYTKNGIRWGIYANDFGISETDLFAGGIMYRAKIYLCADEGYAFHKNHKGEYDVQVFVNGREAKYEADGDLMTVTYEEKAGEVWISRIDMMGIDFPEVGNTPDCVPESAFPNYYGAKEDSGAISWYEDGQYMDKTDTFKAGKAYSVKLYVDAVRIGWDDVVIFSEEMSATIDGFTVRPDNLERLSDSTVVITYTFPKLEREFSDVPSDAYYCAPVMWAVEQGITSGTGEETFSPEAFCTRGQVVTFLHRMVGSPEPAAITLPFDDVTESDYFYKSVKWAFGSKIASGTGENSFGPNLFCTRAQTLTFLWRTAGQPEPRGTDNPFVDVSEGSYYYKAVLWAVENGITGGTSANTFSPDGLCTRGQVVTFLYRFIGNS